MLYRPSLILFSGKKREKKISSFFPRVDPRGPPVLLFALRRFSELKERR